MVDSKLYPPASDDSYDENDVMPGNVEEFANSVIGHKIVHYTQDNGYGGSGDTRFILDNGTVVRLRETSDCCAGTDMRGIMQMLPDIDHVITAVKPNADYTEWHIMAGMDELLKLDVSWSAGSGYYMYGFIIEVEEA